MSLRTEENKQEFKEASRVATTFKYAASKYVSKLNLQGRLTGKMLEVVQADTNNVRGERKFDKNNVVILKNFNLGKHSVQSLVHNAFAMSIVDNAGEKKAVLSYATPLIAATDINKPNGATHVELSVVLLAVDFGNSDNLPIIAEKKETLPLNDTTPISNIETQTAVIPDNYTVFALVETHFSQSVNGINYPLEAKNLNACFIADTV